MSESAAESGRSAKMRRTRIAITEHARKLTAEHGLAGFTIEDVCEPVGISRRTFFNYFPSKEAAVIGSPAEPFESAAMQRFVASGTRSGQISPTLLDDMVEVAIEMMDEVFDIAGTITHVNQIIAREPEFMEKFMQDSEEVHQRFTSLIEEREGLTPGDPRAGVAIQVLGSLLHHAAHAFFGRGETGSIGPELRRTLALSRELFTGSAP
ncbi:TetR/AcrR family transcriptional regulator [Leucobacter chromiireducens]|uniref:TetR/AcrR family transcriptional regulator n=1 Tax=Leucobacter chromiireducens TaxID=283877 RepID=UPI000F630F9E|nr:TetR/AcrR family transcriptional regulator [Leucobacter chromiireducens]